MLSVAATEWMEGKKLAWSPKMTAIAENALRHLLPQLGKRLLVDLEARDIFKYQKHRLAEGASNKEIARRLGAVATINVTGVRDVVAAVKNLTGDERGADAVVEAAGNPATWKQALDMVRRGGVVNFFSGLPSGTNVEIEPAAIHYSEIKIISPFHHTPRFIREALEASARRAGVTEELQRRRRMTVEEMLAVRAEIAAMPLLDPRSPQDMIDDINAP